MNSPPDSTMSRPTSGAATPPRPARSRTQSISSDRPSLFAYSLMSPPLSVSPEAAFIAASAASQIVTNDHDTHSAMWYDQHGIEPSGETALVTSAALQLVNNFLDQLLFNILSVSRSTSLAALRPAVTDVLKPKLAKDAINQADEELREYLGGGDEDELLEPSNGESSRDWDLELVWKRTRLRCMVYSSLGDMEEEDEDYYMDQEGLELGPDEQLFDVISPAVAIFLTSILEYMGEQALVVAGQGACHRLQTRLEKEVREGKRDPNEAATRIVVDDLDMDRVALDRTLGRLWRAWKKRIRSPTFESRPYSRGSMRSFHYRQNSAVPFDHPLPEDKPEDAEASNENPSLEQEIDELALAAAIALPTGHRDVDEIEVPGLAVYSDDEDDDDMLEDDFETRPKSMIVLGHPAPISPLADAGLLTEEQLTESRPRSNSVPTLPSIALAFRRGRKMLTLDIEASTPDVADGNLDEQGDDSADTVEVNVAVNGTQETGALDQSYTELDEEPEQFEILTSSRVSISGGISPVPSDADTQSRSSSRQTGRPASLVLPRLVEVAAPRSPVSRSPSTQKTADASPVVSATPNELHSSQVSETIYRSPIASPASRPQTDRLNRTGNTHVNPSISEAEEDVSALSARAESTPASTSLPTPNSFRGVPAPPLKEPQAPLHSASYQQSTPAQVPSTTKVTILRTSETDGRVDHVPSDVAREVAANQSSRGATSRYPKLNTAPATIGMVSVEKPRAQQDLDEFVPTAVSVTASRPTHTSGGSSVSSGASRLKTVRSSEESGGPARPEDVARNFEELIHSDQTIQYTLTPESMRDIDSNSLQSYSPVLQSKSRRSDDIKRIHTNRSRSSSNATSPIEVKRKASVSRPNGHTAQSSSTSTVKPPGSIPRAPRKSDASSSAASHIHARDARVPRESTADFAEFLRSTGPPGSDTYPVQQHRRGMGSMSSAQGSIDTRRPSTHSKGPRLQARDATVDTKEDNSDLIDFIRRGPSNGAGAHRIPRAVAPFRTTMDSDQMSGAVGGRAIDATIPDIRYSQTSNSINDVAPSMHSSTNSQSALLKHKPSYQRNESFDEEDAMPMPKRKTRRVKDPYAIDFSDEDDDEIFGLPQQSRPATRPARPPAPVQKEESLAEFLMNYDPPAESTRTAFAPPPPQPQSRPKKRSSTSNLIGRLRGHGSQSNNTIPTLPTITSAPRVSTSSNGRGYVPIQVNMPPGYDRYGLIDQHAAPPKTSSSGGGGRVQMKRFEPRDPVSSASASGTSELAAFLRNSEPPPPVRPSAQYPPPAQEPGGSSMSKMLGRRKKSLMA